MGENPLPPSPERQRGVHSILIVEDDPAIQLRLQRVAMRALPQAHSHIAGSLAEAHALLAAQRFDLALLDVGLPDGVGLDLLPWLNTHAPDTDAVVITSFGDDRTVLRAIQGGAVGYLLKNGDDMELELALRCMERGGAPIDPIIARRILRLMAAAPTHTAPSAGTAAAPPAEAPTEREMEVLRLVAQGQSNREIAQHLFLSINTVECHAKNIYRKLAVRSRGAAVHSARALGLLP